MSDVLDAIHKIEIHIHPIINTTGFGNNVTALDAVERRLAIIGEALWQINKRDKTVAITDKRKIIALRHILIHEYDLIDKATIWKIVTEKLPTLKKEVEQLIGKVDGPTKH